MPVCWQLNPLNPPKKKVTFSWWIVEQYLFRKMHPGSRDVIVSGSFPSTRVTCTSIQPDETWKSFQRWGVASQPVSACSNLPTSHICSRPRWISSYGHRLLVMPLTKVGFILSSDLPCTKNIQKIVSVFANRTGRICLLVSTMQFQGWWATMKFWGTYGWLIWADKPMWLLIRHELPWFGISETQARFFVRFTWKGWPQDRDSESRSLWDLPCLLCFIVIHLQCATIQPF